MAFKRITENDMLGKGNVGKPDTPGVSTSEMQRIMDELPREVIAPAFNELSGQLEADTASADIGANAPDGITPDPAPAENSPAKLQSVLQGIVNKITDHIADQVKHVTSEERTSWNNASNDRHTHNNKSILDGITSSLVGNWNAAFAHVSDAVRHITENERTNWNDKYTKSETDKAINERVVEIGSSDMTKAVYDPETRNLPYIPKIDAEALTLGKNVVLSGTPVSIAYAGAQRIASITAYGETPQGGTTEAPVALTGISSVTVNDDVTEMPIPRPLRRVGDVRDVCVTRKEHEGAEKLVVTYNVGFVELDGTENWSQGTGSNAGYLQASILMDTNESHLAVSSIAHFKYQYNGDGVFTSGKSVVFGAAIGKAYTVDTWKAYLAAQKSAGTPVQIAYQFATAEVYATDPLDFDNAAGPLTVMTGGEVEVRMTELLGTRSDVSNNTAAFTEAEQDADIASGEKLSVLFGKIKKRFSVLASTVMMKNVFTQVGNPNLLDNSDFMNPVNQRGSTSYIDMWKYCIDRWTLIGKYDVAAHTLTFQADNAIERFGLTLSYMRQGITGLNIGDRFTLSASVGGVVYSHTITLATDMQQAYNKGPFLFTVEYYGSTNVAWFGIGVTFGSVSPEWMKVEKGNIATPYVPKGYGVELAECQRYYLRVPAWQMIGSGYVDWEGKHIFIMVPTPCTMRIAPTVSSISGTSYCGDGTTSAYSGTPGAINRPGWVVLDLSGTFTQKNQTATFVMGNTPLELSSDL